MLRVRLLPYAETDLDVFSFSGNQRLLEQLRGRFADDEYLLYKTALNNRNDAREEAIDSRVLLDNINKVFHQWKDDLVWLPHNLQYYAYAIKHGSLNLLVNYNKAITCALCHFVNGRLEESAKQLSKLTEVTELEEQLREYALLSVLKIEN